MPSADDQDQPMVDVSTREDAPNPGGSHVPLMQDSTHNRIRVLPGGSDTAASFEFEEEDHTLGNALRYIIMKNPDVELCGYSIPHPSEPKMNLRIQTYGDANVYDVLDKGLNDLMDLCDVVTEKFTVARDDFNARS